MPSLIFSGIQPSGAVHIGNYFGALKNWVKLQAEFECIYCIVDYHAMTLPYEAKEMPKRVLECALDILACGVDPEKSLLFVQSHVPQHTELAWFLNCVAPMGELNRMTQFKEKSERTEANVGLYTYPVLQAADILIYKADLVPVGEDQVQHLELTREVARRFNGRFGEIFPEPKPRLTKAARIMDLGEPTRKMSKSVGGSAIMLSDSEDVIKKQVKRAVTDVGPIRGPQGGRLEAPLSGVPANPKPTDEMSPGVANLFTLLEETAEPEVFAKFQTDYEAGALRYSDLKAALTESMLTTLRPIRQRREELAARPERVIEILRASAAECRRRADQTMAEVRQATGLTAAL